MPSVSAESPYPEATLAPGGSDYDEEHPENLEEDQLYAWSAILIEADSGRAIFEKSPDEIRHPASTTKIMTCYLGILFVDDLYQTVTVSQNAVNVPEGSSTMKLQAGEVIPLIDVLYGTMLLSGNDGANVIAETVSGSIEAFVELMNQTAALLGCTNTHFNNAHGYTDPYHYSTARDMAIIAREAMKNETFRTIAAASTYTISRTNMTRARTITSTNELFRPSTEENPNRYYYPYANGVKTGNTDAAQYCFVGSAEQEGVNLISVVMYSGKRARWRDTILLMNYGFAQYVSVTPIDLYNLNPIVIETSSYSTQDSNLGKLQLRCVAQDAAAAARARIVMTRDQVDATAMNLRNLTQIQYVRDFRAPIEAGELMGTMTYFTDSGEMVIYDLRAARTVAARENVPKTLEQLWTETLEEGNPLPRMNSGTLSFLVLVLIVSFVIYRLILFLLSRRRKQPRIPRVGKRYLKK